MRSLIWMQNAHVLISSAALFLNVATETLRQKKRNTDSVGSGGLLIDIAVGSIHVRKRCMTRLIYWQKTHKSLQS